MGRVFGDNGGQYIPLVILSDFVDAVLSVMKDLWVEIISG